MSNNNDGMNGIDIEQIGIEKNVLVGVQAPNLYPSVKISTNGRTLPKATISTNKGMDIQPTAGYLCSHTDTSWMSHGGIYSMSAGNKINLTSGGGGIEITTLGPLNFTTSFADFFATHCFNVTTRLFTVSTSERTHMMGNRIDFQYDETYFTGNVNFINNVAFNGSVFINGELFCTHMTSMGQINNTHTSPDLTGYVNPGQSFLVCSGCSTNAKIAPFVDCMITIPFPDPISQTLSLPCKIKFINGISLASDAVIKNFPDDTQITIQQGAARTPNPSMTDLMGPGHQHTFIGPSFTPTPSTSDMLSEAKVMMESDSPSTAKKTTPNGCTSVEQFITQCEEALTNELKKWATRGKKYITGLFGFGEE